MGSSSVNQKGPNEERQRRERREGFEDRLQQATAAKNEILRELSRRASRMRGN